MPLPCTMRPRRSSPASGLAHSKPTRDAPLPSQPPLTTHVRIDQGVMSCPALPCPALRRVLPARPPARPPTPPPPSFACLSHTSCAVCLLPTAMWPRPAPSLLCIAMGPPPARSLRTMSGHPASGCAASTRPRRARPPLPYANCYASEPVGAGPLRAARSCSAKYVPCSAQHQDTRNRAAAVIPAACAVNAGRLPLPVDVAHSTSAMEAGDVEVAILHRL